MADEEGGSMCRWLAYSGSPLLLDDLLYKPKHSLIDQSLHARLGPHTTNGDGFGIGWYGNGETPALFKSVDPIWNDRNLREISSQICSPLVFAHIRASTGTPVQQTNCHPFRYGKWLWMHNGQIARFAEVKRDLVMAIDPDLYPSIEGSSDTEIFSSSP
jgi:glutamine amidotransferase